MHPYYAHFKKKFKLRMGVDINRKDYLDLRDLILRNKIINNSRANYISISNRGNVSAYIVEWKNLTFATFYRKKKSKLITVYTMDMLIERVNRKIKKELSLYKQLTPSLKKEIKIINTYGYTVDLKGTKKDERNER